MENNDPNNNKILEKVAEVAEETPEKVEDEVEKAAEFISKAHASFRQLAYALSRKKNSVARVLEAVLFEPLEEVKLIGKQEEQLFEICRHVMYNKGKVMRYAFEKAEAKHNKGEESNG